MVVHEIAHGVGLAGGDAIQPAPSRNFDLTFIDICVRLHHVAVRVAGQRLDERLQFLALRVAGELVVEDDRAVTQVANDCLVRGLFLVHAPHGSLRPARAGGWRRGVVLGRFAGFQQVAILYGKLRTGDVARFRSRGCWSDPEGGKGESGDERQGDDEPACHEEAAPAGALHRRTLATLLARHGPA